ncbi:VOC family protein [[Mycobacterium] burgundiense]|uniref:VOC family protein n=1 Tax=[Mycobacterium] burgundiense TaxID=3064286 RepID=A0ABM9M1B9_9MYCO|nr:VOC family protein [Mycolicibacterium sp. MU0053]CAJ1508412.1 VOC family protein [Mycolicibacterium sp. MU0053]
MSGTDTVLADLGTQEPAPPPFVVPRPAALPYLSVPDARRALQWYVDAFGAVRIGEPIVMDDNRIGHAELGIGGGVLYLADDFPELGLRAPAAGATSVSLMLPVADPDAVLDRARANGATVAREIEEAHGSRGATIIDPFGHRWMITGPMRGAAMPIRHGDVGYVSLWTPDAARAAAFYQHVLGWVVDPAYHRVTSTAEPVGIFEAAGPPTLFCSYAVADLSAARAAILDAGGTVGETRQFPFGPVLDATDPQGMAFAVFEPTTEIGRPALNGAGPGELSYITHSVPDARVSRDFYGRVLHWSFESGRVDDGWAVLGCHPMTGIGGGAETATIVPMWTVDDIDAAVVRVREAGGSVLQEPTRQDYGMMAECADDQGARFYLGQF